MDTLHDAVEALDTDLHDLMVAYLQFSGVDLDRFERVCRDTDLPPEVSTEEPVLVLLWATEHVFFREEVTDALLVFLRSRCAFEHVKDDVT
jgi:hypothetical protein